MMMIVIRWMRVYDRLGGQKRDQRPSGMYHILRPRYPFPSSYTYTHTQPPRGEEYEVVQEKREEGFLEERI